MERHRPRIAAGDARRRRYEAALGVAAGKSSPLCFELRGVALTPAGVLLGAVPVGSAADEFAALLARELGPDGWLEASRPRDLWYLTLVHFAGPHVDDALVEWVAERRGLELGTTTVDAAQLVIWRYNGRHVVPDPLTTFPLGG
ncbi:hypothetical protein [Streptomyces chartreusis]|uniref:hypothetical protein n=1 Tax=Streptomyces chartreusis TaxID=1969 RepID=UPI00382E1EB8